MSEFSSHEPKKGVFAISSKTDVLEDIRTFLRDDAEFELIGFSQTGREGIEKAVELKPAIVLVDRSIFDIDSIEVAEHVYANLTHTEVIMMSVSNEPDWMRTALITGVRLFLTKPLCKEEFSLAIRYSLFGDKE